MLGELHIRDLGVIDDARLEVAPGLNVLTGETGAGKTMVVDALSLLLGERADAGVVRVGRPAALVEGRVAVEPRGQAAEALTTAGVADEEGEVVVARQVMAGGGSRAQLQGRMATVAAVAEVMRALVEVHGQHEFQRLLRPGVQLDLLDRFAGPGVLSLRDDFAVDWQRLRTVAAELEELRARAQEREREADLLRYQLGEIDQAEVRVGELDELGAETERLANAEALRDAALAAWQALAGEDEESGAATALGGAARALAGPGGHDAALGELGERSQALAAEVGDLASSLRAYAERVLVDPERLATVQARVALLRDLERKYGEDEAAVLAFAERGRARLAELEGGTIRSEKLEAEQAALRRRLAELGTTLSGERAAAAERMAAAVQGELADLAMPHARVLVELSQEAARDDDPTGLDCDGRRLAGAPHGLDRIEMLLSANPGNAPRPLARAASGGELSRVMLALRVVLAEAGRVTELSRMLAGMEGSGLAQAHAEELLAAASAVKGSDSDRLARGRAVVDQERR